MKRALQGSALILLVCFALGCRSVGGGRPQGSAPRKGASPGWVERTSVLDQAVPGLLREYRVAGAGVALIRDGAVVWTGYYGEQAPGVPVSARTVFNTASVAKTVTAETLLVLAAKGLLSLDEPIAPYVAVPDLEKDSRFGLLTPRLLLSHRSGLLNWPYNYADGHVAFVHDPGTTFSYSGFGVELAARYAEAKLGKDFGELAREHLLAPLGATEMSLGRLEPWMEGRLAVPMNAEGKYLNPREPPYVESGPSADGEWSGADNLLTTVEAYARFLTGILGSSWLSDEWIRERKAVLTSLEGDPIWSCVPAPGVQCAQRYGHGLGWMVYEFAGKTVLKHGGNDQGENALVYFSPETRSGGVIFVDGGNGIFVTVGILDLLGDQPEIAAYYRQLVQRHYKVALPARSTP